MAKKKNKSKKVATKKNKSTLTKEQIKKFNKLQDEADDNTESGGYYIDEFKYCYGNLAQDLCDAGDKEWARRIYKIVEDKFNRGQMDESFSFLDLANDVAQNLGDKIWARKIYKEAEKDDEVERSKLAESISENLGDKEWAKKIRGK